MKRKIECMALWSILSIILSNKLLQITVIQLMGRMQQRNKDNQQAIRLIRSGLHTPTHTRSLSLSLAHFVIEKN